MRLIFAMLIVLAAGLIAPAFAQEKTGNVDVYIKNEKNERVTPEGITVKVYKNQEKTPIQEINSLQTNPFTISSLPLDQRYSIEVYANSMYATTEFIDLKKNTSIEIPIKNAGGLLLNIYYKDGETPLPGAKVWIKSHDGKWWSYSETAQNGQAIRAWLYPTTKLDDHYFAEISLGQNLKYIYTPIKLEAGIAQDLKIVTKWPVIVDKSFPVEVYNNTKNKVTKQDGSFVAQLYDSKKNRVAESQVTAKGTANFSKLKVGNYALYVKSQDVSGQLNTVAAKKVTITDDTGIIKIYLNNPELNSDNLNCNCVAFRLDDVQDYFLAPAQIELISLFERKDTTFTIGVIGGLIGTDKALIDTIKGGLAADPPIEIASHSWNNKVLSTLSKKEQESLIIQTNDKIKSLFGITPTVFIPPENLFNNDTISVLKTNGFTHLSHATTTREPPIFKKSSFYEFPIVPATARLDPSAGIWRHISNDTIMEKIEESIFEYGYAVVMMHPYEFAQYENGFYVNKVNSTKIQELDSLIDQVRQAKYKILPIGQIHDFDKLRMPKPQAAPEPEKPKMPDCNCVAFRMDNFQDFWLNDVQNKVIDTFDKNKTPLTVSVIGKFTGDDPNSVNFLKEKLGKTSNIKIANRGWEYIDHTTFDKQRQTASIKQTNEKITKVFGKTATVFSPPYDAFNKDTVDAASEAKMAYFSASITSDKLSDGHLKHIPSTLSFVNLVSDDPFVAGTIPQKALTKTQTSITQNGFAVISLQSSDFAVKTDTFKNEVNQEKIQLLESLISDVRSSGMKIVLLEQIPGLISDDSIAVPDWVKSNAQWWSEGKIGDSDFTKGIQYLIKEKIIKVPQTEKETTAKKIPDWIKSNAKWWSEGKISNGDFVKGLQYLIQNGIIAA
ncbi:polysaccharide deacetylase family protein [Candidatus Nitrosotenuis aquarius]|uniref:polysaccharide deacetylase family protein n=1 Tax=Candidatus Nitrosotenuis aquarius TaxID=1846278 RepID=UPI000C1F6099|nr:polysaccharide deacetylase family protein [Candidatus Nitrosotenuis aquarius]